MQKRAFEVGYMIEHSKFGRGEVLKIYGDFRDIWFHQLGVEKRIREDHLAPSTDQTRTPRRKLRLDSGKTGKPRKQTKTYDWDSAITAFSAAFPLAFDDPAYQSQERDWKDETATRVKTLVKPDGALAAGAAGDGPRAADALRQCIPQPPKGKSSLLSPFELIALQAALNDHEAASRLAAAVLALVSEPESDDESALGRYFEAVNSLPATTKNNPAKWPVATLFPFMADPDRHMFLKPVATRAAAAALGVAFDYQPSLNAQTYRSLLILARTLRERLTERFPEHPPKNAIDLQTFIVWCQENAGETAKSKS